MTYETKTLINSAVLKIIENTSSPNKLKKLNIKHDKKLHFIPKRYRVFGGLLQSMNIQFGNFIELLMTELISSEEKYEIIKKYSGKKSNIFKISETNEKRIDEYISRCQYGDVDLELDFKKLLDEIVGDNDTNYEKFSHDIDILFRDKITGKVYYIEAKYNDDHDTGKFVDINRKFIKTYAYLAKELQITSSENLIPILFFFTNKKLKGNIYVPESNNIRRGKRFFDDFLSVSYNDVDEYLSLLSESDDIIKMFDNLYKTVINSEN